MSHKQNKRIVRNRPGGTADDIPTTIEKRAFNYYACQQHSTIHPKSDQREHGIVKRHVPSRGSSTSSSITRHRPGGASAAGTGVDVKHGSYDRYLAKKKKALFTKKPYQTTKYDGCDETVDPVVMITYTQETSSGNDFGLTGNYNTYTEISIASTGGMGESTLILTSFDVELHDSSSTPFVVENHPHREFSETEAGAYYAADDGGTKYYTITAPTGEGPYYQLVLNSGDTILPISSSPKAVFKLYGHFKVVGVETITNNIITDDPILDTNGTQDGRLITINNNILTYNSTEALYLI